MEHLLQLTHFTQEPSIKVFLSNDIVFYNHLHFQYELLYVISGELEITLENNTFLLKKNTIAFFPSNCVHGYKTIDKSRCYIVIFDPKDIYDFNLMFKEKRLINNIFDCQIEHVFYLNALKQLVHNYDINNKISLYGYLNVLIGELSKRFEFEKNKLIESTNLQKILQYVDKNFTEDITLEHVSKNVHLSKYYVSKLFNQKIGCSFNHYLNILRINKSKNLLCSDMSIIEIAYESGYNNLRCFYRAFKSIVETTPMIYRKTRT